MDLTGLRIEVVQVNIAADCRESERNTSKRGLLSRLALAVTAAAMLLVTPVSFAASDIDVAPPPPRVIKMPPPRPGFVWAPGYYRWDGHRHVWVDGHFMRERRGSHWVAERWNERHGRYRFVPGHWERD